MCKDICVLYHSLNILIYSQQLLEYNFELSIILDDVGQCVIKENQTKGLLQCFE